MFKLTETTQQRWHYRHITKKNHRLFYITLNLQTFIDQQMNTEKSYIGQCCWNISGWTTSMVYAFQCYMKKHFVHSTTSVKQNYWLHRSGHKIFTNNHKVRTSSLITLKRKKHFYNTFSHWFYKCPQVSMQTISDIYDVMYRRGSHY